MVKLKIRYFNKRRENIMSPSSFFSYFNPISTEHHAIERFGNLKHWQKAVTGAVTGLAILVTLVTIPIFGFPFILGVAVFRALTEKFSITHIKPVERSRTYQNSVKKTNNLFNASKPIKPVERSRTYQNSVKKTNNLFNASKPIKPSEEEVRQAKRDAKAHNRQESSYLGIPENAHQLILSHLSDSEDLKNVALTSEQLNQQVKSSMGNRVSPAKETIAQMIEFAMLLNDEIKRITENKESLIGLPEKITKDYSKFKFDVEKWQAILENIDKKPDLAAEFDALQNDCCLDLVEALAEYNINPNIIDDVIDDDDDYNDSVTIEEVENRLISQIDVDNIAANLTTQQAETLKQILGEARCTLKGDVQVTNITSASFFRPMIPLPNRVTYEKGYREGPFAFVHLCNPESEDWINHGYKRCIKGYAIHIEWLIGKKEGDRIIIPRGREGTSDRQVILRIRGEFERKIALGVLVMSTHEEDPKMINQAAKDKIIENMENAYGKEFLDKIRKSMKE